MAAIRQWHADGRPEWEAPVISSDAYLDLLERVVALEQRDA